MINQLKLPEFLDSILAYLYGFKAPELSFLLLCLTGVGIVLMYPRRGPKACAAALILALGAFLLGPIAAGLWTRPYPFVDLGEQALLRLEFVKGVSAFPVRSVMVLAGFVAAISYYFPEWSKLSLLGMVIYALGPVYLGVAYPSDAISSLGLGFLMSYFAMTFLSQVAFFDRHGK